MTAESEFLNQAREKFGDRFDYNKMVYAGAKTPAVIGCGVHGDFTQAPHNHLRSAYGCPSCAESARSSRGVGRKGTKTYHSTDKYLARVSLPEGYTIDMSRYIGITAGEVGITCPTHGTIWEPPRSVLLRGYPCSRCGQERAKPATKDFENFKTEAEKIHGPKYTYKGDEYENRKSVLTILCASHGPFKKSAQKHLSGQGCSVCLLMKNTMEGKYPGGYSENYFRDHPEVIDLPATLYYARVGRRYKIGVTAGPIRRRLASIQSNSKQPTSLIKTWDLPLREAYREEQRILAIHASRRIARRWSTEVFDGDVLRLDI